MDTVEILDNIQQLRLACNDLDGARSLIILAADNAEYISVPAALGAVEKALCSVIGDIREAVDGIDKAVRETGFDGGDSQPEDEKKALP